MRSEIKSSLFVFLSFLVWIYVFRGFLSGELSLRDDAASYYDHTKFFIDNLSSGIFPLWDPTWSAGVPNEFFLRRIGSYNPLYLLMAAMQAIGLPPTKTYLVFIGAYFLLGAAGHYLLLKRILKDHLIAFMGMLLLIFSSFSFVVFGSFIILIFTPAVWFVYFLFAFLQTGRRKDFLGACFCVMILMTTYIPFYFLTLILTLLLLCVSLFHSRMPRVFFETIAFAKVQAPFVAVCLVLVGLSLVPGWRLFQEAKKEAFVLPTRHVEAATDNVFGVDLQEMHEGAVVSPRLLVKELFSAPDKMDLNRSYLPPAIFVILLMGAFTRVSRVQLVVFLWGLCFFLLSLKGATPVYGFLYDHVFYFKYFRNLQFFFLLTFYPAVSFLAAAILKQFMEQVKPAFLKSVSAYVIVLLIVTAPAVWALSHLEKNAARRMGPYTYDAPYRPFAYLRGEPRETDLDRARQIGAPDYYATAHYAGLKASIDQDILHNYLHHKFVIYDAAVFKPRAQAEDFERVFFHRSDQAIVDGKMPEGSNGHSAAQALFVSGALPEFQVTDFDANTIAIRSNFSAKKFVVYNDSYHPDWLLTIDDRPAPVFRSNMAFKGWWVPAGERRILLRFGSPTRYLWNYFYLAVFAGTLVSLLVLWRKERAA